VVGQVLPGRGAVVEVVDLIDQDQVGAGVDEDLADRSPPRPMVIASMSWERASVSSMIGPAANTPSSRGTRTAVCSAPATWG
jgi:hypothetical protein